MAISWLKRFTWPQAAPQPVADAPLLGGRTAQPAVGADGRPDVIAVENPVAPVVLAARVEVPPDQIVQRAFEKWVRRGRPAGTSDRDWLEAEAELRAESTPPP